MRRQSAGDRPPPPPPDLAIHAGATLPGHEGRWLAVAMLADEPDIGTGTDPREALRAAFAGWGARARAEAVPLNS